MLVVEPGNTREAAPAARLSPSPDTKLVARERVRVEVEAERAARVGDRAFSAGALAGAPTPCFPLEAKNLMRSFKESLLGSIVFSASILIVREWVSFPSQRGL